MSLISEFADFYIIYAESISGESKGNIGKKRDKIEQFHTLRRFFRDLEMMK